MTTIDVTPEVVETLHAGEPPLQEMWGDTADVGLFDASGRDLHHRR